MAWSGRRRGNRTASAGARARAPQLSEEEWAAYQAHPQNWLAFREYGALVEIVKARDPRLLEWFATTRTRLLLELRAEFKTEGVPTALLLWSNKLEQLRLPKRIVPRA